MNGVVVCDLEEDEGEGTDVFLGVLLGAFDAAGMDLYPLGSVE